MNSIKVDLTDVNRYAMKALQSTSSDVDRLLCIKQCSNCTYWVMHHRTMADIVQYVGRCKIKSDSECLSNAGTDCKDFLLKPENIA